MKKHILLRVAGASVLSMLRAHCNLKSSSTSTNHHTHLNLRMASSSSGTELEEFSSVLSKAKKITVLTGAGISAESGIPTFRGAGGLWRTWSAMNIDGLHWKAGSKDVVELHGSLWKTQCCRCDDVQENYDKPICPALDGKGAPDPHTKDAQIPVAELPHCRKCNGLLRPHVVWFGECLDPTVLDRAENALIKCDLLLVVGTSAVVQPAAGFAPIVQGGGGVVAEFNIEDTPISRSCRFKFHGSSTKTFPQALGISPEDLVQT